MTVVEHGYSEPKRRGSGKVIKNSKTINGVDNPHVGIEWGQFLSDCGESRHTDHFYYVSYILVEFGDEIQDALDDMEKEDLEEYAIEIEERQAIDEEDEKDQELEQLLDNANVAEKQNIIEQAKDTLQNSSIEDEQVHEDMVREEN